MNGQKFHQSYITSSKKQLFCLLNIDFLTICSSSSIQCNVVDPGEDTDMNMIKPWLTTASENLHVNELCGVFPDWTLSDCCDMDALLSRFL